MDKKQTKKEYIKIFNEKILPFLRVEEVGRKRLLFECIKLYIQEALFWLAFLALLAFFSKLVSFKDAILFNFLFIFYNIRVNYNSCIHCVNYKKCVT